MNRAELRAQLEAKGIIMPDWPVLALQDSVLVVDEWGCGASVHEAMDGTRKDMARCAVVEWAEATEESGGFGGDPYPNGKLLYSIFHDGEVIEVQLSVEAAITFRASLKAA